ncbi:MAG: hypothetical protein B7Y25_03820 [Alphaproteobacteria bacterium 16-39-46]|nr:MAG: hypothetical protein B7Y25_03820 [Alphaproteobacteria bacterium 16-39-46]OZA43286.1 MAG: hypothetical protein B7X84_03655 [Alphaproteobacteria bacterium 17-39-52]HQS84064.1 hypothetical protein [Alphaproteobacteria bacterium]HQS93926.1 hypothetical protein [Alphaproteobacteria bacterium]
MRRCLGSFVLLLSFILGGSCYSEASDEKKSVDPKTIADIKRCRQESCPNECHRYDSFRTDNPHTQECGKCAIICVGQVVKE